MANSVRIRIGGELDQSLARSLASANSQIQRAEKQAQRAKKETSNAAAAEARKQMKAQEALTRAAESLDRQRSRALYDQFRAQEAGAQRAARAQMQAAARAHAAERREIEKTVRLAQRAFEQEARDKARAARASVRRDERSGESFARRTSHRATRFLMPEAPIGPMVMRGLGDVARGAGVDFSIQGMVSRNVGLQQAATDLSNSGYQAGNAGPNGQRVDPRALVAQSRAVAGQFGIDAGEALGALAQYQKIAGDLDTGRQTLFQMAALSKATGTNLQDMAAATANVSNGLGDVPDKARVIDEVMRTIAGQGKLGAVEISDMAVQMARIAATATSFGGDRAKNIQTFGALAQIARAEGGAPSAAESARSMGGFANTLKKTARIEAFKKEGIDVFTDKSKTTLRDPMALIKESLLATGGDMQRMNKLFMDVVGARTVGGLQKTFVRAGGGQAGLAKVDEQVQRMMKAQISQDEVKESARRAAETDAAKAARFQNSLDAITETTMKTLVPALEQAGPAILSFAEVIGRVATWATTNPKTAIMTAITASIARAGIESAFRSGIERLLLGPTGPDGAGTRAAGLGGLAAKAGGILTIASLGVTTLTVGMAIIDNWFLKAQREQSEAVAKGAEATNLSTEARALEKGGNLKGALEKQKESVAAKEEEIKRTEALKGGGVGDFLARMFAASTSTGLMSGAGTAGIKGPANEVEASLKARDVALENATRQQLKELATSRGLLDRIATAVEKQPPPDSPGEGRGTN